MAGLGQALGEIFGMSGGGLVSDRVDDAEHVLGAMIDFAHEEVFLFLALFAFGNVLSSATKTQDPSLRPDTFKIREPVTLYPADRAVLPPNPELVVDVRLRIGGIEGRLAVRPKPLRIVRIHPIHDLTDRYLIGGKIENFLSPRIHRDYAAVWIVLPPPELGCIKSELQAIFAHLQLIFARPQVVLRRLPPRGGPSNLPHQNVDLGDRGSPRRHRATSAQSDCSARP